MWDWPPCNVVFFGLATNALNVRNNNNNNNNMNFGVELADHGFSERRTSPEMVIYVFGGLCLRWGLAPHSQGRCSRVSQPVVTRVSPNPAVL